MRIYFEPYEANVEYLSPGYKEVSFHIIFDVNIQDNLRPRSQMIAGGHDTTTPYSLTYLYAVSQNSVSIYLKITALNCFELTSFDRQN